MNDISSGISELVWFRRNLRVADNPALTALADSKQAAPLGVFFYDQQYTGSWLGMPRCRPLRAKFLWESVQDLQEQLQGLGGELLVQEGEPEDLLPKICQSLGITRVHTQRLFAYEESESAERVLQALHAIGVELVQHECYTLWPSAHVFASHPQPLSSFSKFRRKVGAPENGARKNGVVVAKLWHQNENGARENGVVVAKLWHQSLEHTSLTKSPIPIDAELDERSVLLFQGGEKAGRARLHDYCSKPVGHYKETRNGLIGADYSSKLSPWLNLGCIAPSQVLRAVREYERAHGENASTEWLIVELLWRDFFQFLAAERGAELFKGIAEPKGEPQGKPSGKVPEDVNSGSNFEKGTEEHDNDPNFSVPGLSGAFGRWCWGKAENAFLNANMRELEKTGYMSNRGRQNAASALIHDMGIDWRLGALWFEANLLDYDPGSNYGNWQYIAGLAANPRGGSWFNLKKQAQMYDTKGEYQKLWDA
ncbi:DASH family cryptochrome [Aliidiomarina iranensis]|nr:DASH family cryptochrome [Aliidiomarina iranensis]